VQFRSGSLICAISRTWSIVTLPTCMGRVRWDGR
jgi:hypothetical protein